MIIASISPPPMAKYPGASVATPWEVRLSIDPFPVMATAMISAIATTTISASSIPTAAVLIRLTILVEATASTHWTSSTTKVIIRAVPSSGSNPTSGISAWLTRAKSTATTAITR